MAYTTPNAAQVPGDIITSAIWNALQNNILYLKGAAGTIAFDAGATFSGVVTATAGIVATTISASGLIKTAGGIVSAGVISGADWLDLTGDTPHILIHSSGSGRLRFVVGGLSYGQIAADASDTFLDFGGANKRLIIRSEVEGTNVIYMQSGGISFVGAQTVDGVDVSALHKAGSYTGTSGARQITVGFATKWATICRATVGADTDNEYSVYAMSGQAVWTTVLHMSGGLGHGYAGTPYLHGTDGFVVNTNYGNDSGVPYFYIAYGQGTA
jgi:hypothetical protein